MNRRSFRKNSSPGAKIIAGEDLRAGSGGCREIQGTALFSQSSLGRHNDLFERFWDEFFRPFKLRVSCITVLLHRFLF